MDKAMVQPYNPNSVERNGYPNVNGSTAGSTNVIKRQSKTSSIPTYQHYSENIKPQNGCLLLGQCDTPEEGYTTRFRIDTNAERRNASSGIFLEECCLCTAEENRETTFKCMAAIIMSEGLLLTIHLTALALGVAKSCINRENIDKEVELIHSIFEVLAVSFVLFARVMLVWKCQNAIKTYRKHHQHVEIEEGESIVGNHLKFIVVSFTVTCIVFEVMIIASFFIFYYFVHLGWTTLVNNFALIIATTVGNIILVKLEKVRTTVIEDEHKVVIYEAVFLLKEGTYTLTEEQRANYYNAVGRYLGALTDTELFQQPPHVKVVEEYGMQWSMVVGGQNKMNTWI